MKIKIWALAFDGNNNGTSCSMYYDLKALHRDLIDWIIGEADTDYQRAVDWLNAGDLRWQELVDIHSEGCSATWEIESLEIDLFERFPHLKDAIEKSERFISGFEDDEDQEGVPDLLKSLRALSY